MKRIMVVFFIVVLFVPVVAQQKTDDIDALITRLSDSYQRKDYPDTLIILDAIKNKIQDAQRSAVPTKMITKFDSVSKMKALQEKYSGKLVEVEVRYDYLLGAGIASCIMDSEYIQIHYHESLAEFFADLPKRTRIHVIGTLYRDSYTLYIYVDNVNRIKMVK